MNFSESKPDSFRAGLAIAFAAEEATQLCDQAKHLIELGLGRLFDLGEQVRAANLVDIEEQFGVQIRAGAAHSHQIGYLIEPRVDAPELLRTIRTLGYVFCPDGSSRGEDVAQRGDRPGSLMAHPM